MSLPPTELQYLADLFSQTADEIMEHWDDPADAGEQQTPPPLILEAMQRLFTVCRQFEPQQHEGEPALSEAELNDLGRYALQLMDELKQHADALSLTQARDTLSALCLSMAVWIARKGGEINVLEPVCEAAVLLCGQLRNPKQLEQLYHLLAEVIDAVNPILQTETLHNDTLLPWRTLLLTAAEVAVQTRQAVLMESAFQNLLHHIPEEAEDFFRDRMSAVGTDDYPATARAVMERYYRTWCLSSTLH